MKTFILMGLLCAGAEAASPYVKVELGLDTQAPAHRRKAPVILYLANDIFAPRKTTELEKSLDYLYQGLRGEQHHVVEAAKSPGELPIVSRVGSFSKDELEDFKSRPAEDRAFLVQTAKQLQNAVYTLAEVAEGAESVLTRGLCRPNPKYRGALALLRNRRQNAPLGPQNTEWVYWHCGPDQKDTTVSIRKAELSTTAKEDFKAPYSDQGLTSPLVLKTILSDLKIVYPPSDYRFAVVVESTNLDGELLSPQLIRSGTTLPIRKVRDTVLRDRSLFLNTDGKPKAGRELISVFAKLIQTVDPALRPDPGVTLEQFLEAFEKTDLDISTLVLNTNPLDLKALAPRQFPHVGTVYAYSQPAAPFQLTAWAPLFQYTGVVEQSLEDRLRRLFE